MTMYITVDFTGGTPIESAAADACYLATKLACAVKFKFNGVSCFAQPYGDPQTLAHNWRIDCDRQHSACNSHPTSSTEPTK